MNSDGRPLKDVCEFDAQSSLQDIPSQDSILVVRSGRKQLVGVTQEFIRRYFGSSFDISEVDVEGIG
jgi:hypothetical protein